MKSLLKICRFHALASESTTHAITPPRRLLGPPEIHIKPSDPPPSNPPQSPDPFMDLMTEHFNEPPLPKTPPPPMGRTENNSATYISSGNPCLDFFFQVVPDTKSKTITGLLKSAWDRDPLKSLKLVCHLRGVRGTGKSDREGFYSSALWIHDHHPKTLALNVAPIAGFGYIKDLPEILHRILNGYDVREVQKRQYLSWKSKGFLGFKNPKKGKPGHKTPEEVKAEVSAKRKEKREKAAAKAVERYARDPNYRLLYDLVSDFFAESLVADLERLRSGKLNEIGLAAKWCPSLYSPYDCSTLLCEGVRISCGKATEISCVVQLNLDT